MDVTVIITREHDVIVKNKYLDIEMSLRMNTQKRSDVVPTLDEP